MWKGRTVHDATFSGRDYMDPKCPKAGQVIFYEIMKENIEEYVNGKAELAESLFKAGYTCSQSVVLAFSDYVSERMGVDVPTAEKMLMSGFAGFGGGFGRMREVCGCVSGMTAMAGFICPVEKAADSAGRSAKAENYALVQRFAGKFREANGSIICRELLSGAGTAVSSRPEPAARTEEYYKKRPCPALAALAASIVAEEIWNLSGRK